MVARCLSSLRRLRVNRGCGRMEWAVLDWNEPAIKFYRTLGAKPMDEWTVFRLTRDGIARLANQPTRLQAPAFAKATAGSSRFAREEEEVSGEGTYKDRGLRFS